MEDINQFTILNLFNSFMKFISKQNDCSSTKKEVYGQSVLKRNSINLETTGDIIVIIQPLILLSQKLVEKDDESLLTSFQKFLSLVPWVRSHTVKGAAINISLYRNQLYDSILKKDNDIESAIKRKDFYLNFKVRIVVCSNEDVTEYRCNIVAEHLDSLFKSVGAKVENLQHDANVQEESGDETVVTYHVSPYNCINSQVLAVSILCSPVTSRESTAKLRITNKEYVKHLENELKEASEHKYGDVDTKMWEKILDQQVRNCQILQFLLVSHLSPIKVDMSLEARNSKESAFILYNYARICMLMKGLENLINSKQLPVMPKAEEVDFSCLKHKEEWSLFWLFVHRYPELLQEIVEELIDVKSTKVGSFKKHFPTHKIAKFLHRLAHCFSVYYNRVHILLAPLNTQGTNVKLPGHLVPTMWARVYLLKAIQRVMKSCFQLMNIIPPETM